LKRASYFALAIWLCCSAFTSAQTPPASVGEKPVANADEHELGDVEILSDTKGVDFGPYLRRVLHDVRLNWYNLIPEVARSPQMKKGKVSIEFAVLKDGSVAGMKLREPSGDLSLDRAAWGGIIASNPFPLLPSEFNGQYLHLVFRFYYNPDPSMRVSRDVEVVAGASWVFTLRKFPKSAVTWSVTGQGCSGDTCGTINGDYCGLYTAPSSLPMPPLVTVTASSEGSPIFESKVHLVGVSRMIILRTSARVVNGTRHQFSVTIITTEGKVVEWKTPTAKTPLKWTLVGSGCEGAACGTISSDGLYTAPAKVPDPPLVTVTAALESDPSKTDSVSMEIVRDSKTGN